MKELVSLARLAGAACILLTFASISTAHADDCRRSCDGPQVGIGAGALTAAYVAQDQNRAWVASNAAPPAHPYIYRLLSPCAAATAAGEPCQDSDDRACPSGPDQVVRELVLQQRRVVVPDVAEIDGVA